MINFLPLIQIGIFTPLCQVFIICIVFITTVFVQNNVYKETGKLWFYYPPNSLIFFAPIYEEVIFRGIFLAEFISMYGVVNAVILTSILFGIWHIRSILFMPKKKVVMQMLYTGLILGPIFGIVTIVTGSIWIAVILHFLNNLFYSFRLKLDK